jgi:hypothetical protein
MLFAGSMGETGIFQVISLLKGAGIFDVNAPVSFESEA